MRDSGDGQRARFGWPWGDNNPTLARRVWVAIALGLVAGLLSANGYVLSPDHHSDFAQAWIGAKSVLEGVNPYPIVGPGRAFEYSWGLLYPGTAFVAVLPLGLLPEWIAACTFSTVSAALLTYGMTRDSWHRLPAFGSGAFVVAASAAQWSPLFAATWFIPQLAFFYAAKPTLGLAAFLYSPSNRHRVIAVFGGLFLLAISLLLLPSWPADWLEEVRNADTVRSPVTQAGGFLVGLVLLRWRRREAWVVFLMALTPQSHSIYDVLILLVIVPDTYRQAVFLSVASTVGLFLMIIPENTGEPYYSAVGMLRIATCYLPSVILVLRRPNQFQLSRATE